MSRRAKGIGFAALGLLVLGVAALWLATILYLTPQADMILPKGHRSMRPPVLDRSGLRLTATYQNDANAYDRVPLHEIPLLLRDAFLTAEDRRFFSHHGVDWAARMAACWQNAKAFSLVRGASTITEQAARILHPRPRSFWTHWLCGFEAVRLEKNAKKAEILEYYMNQVPFGGNRRGVAQGALYYFNRDLSTLSPREMLALAVLCRAPSRLDPRKSPAALNAAVKRLALTLAREGKIRQSDLSAILASPLCPESPGLSVSAPHAVAMAREEAARCPAEEGAPVYTSLSAELTRKVQELLNRRMKDMASHGAVNGAVIVADHETDQVLAVVVSGANDPDAPGSAINAAITPRQPGSSMKPLLYACALSRGWTAATILDDSPFIKNVGRGLHEYRNYSRVFYGPVTLREALGNSLNIPALRAVQFVGVESYLQTLAALGITGLDRHPDWYGDGIALGNAEVTLFDLTQAYAAVARGGVFRPLSLLLHPCIQTAPVRVFSPEVTSIIADILSDPAARSLEFGEGGVLCFPVATAVKTGTSSDFRDAWAMGFSARYTVGVWMGNLSGDPTRGLTGSRGPALLLRSVFHELEKTGETRPLYKSPNLVTARV
ncbi:MAG: transglycosylase domain-containing protein, partial [Thermodesulfobacteriota bacterium]